VCARADATPYTREDTPMRHRYTQIDATDLPAQGNLRWDTTGADRGQIVEVSYSHGARSYRSEAGRGDPYMRIIDHSDGSIEYYRRRPR